MIRFGWMALAACLLVAPPAQAYPVITYDFTGLLDHTVGGTRQFSGSLVYTNTSNNPQGAAFRNATGDQIQMSLNIGGHTATINVISPFDTPSRLADVDISHNIGYIPGDAFTAFVSDSKNTTDTSFFGSRLVFGIYLSDPSGKALPTNSPDVFEHLDLSKFPIHRFNLGGNFSLGNLGPSGGISGTLTSLTYVSTTQSNPVPAPEPSTLAAFALAGIGIAACRRVRRARSAPPK